jgi:DNA-binding transcriptional ArsR family regulator
MTPMDDAALLNALKAMASRMRLRMVREIAAAGELSCGQVVGHFNLSQPTISHHLRILADAGVIAVREEGQHRFISVNRRLIRQVAEFLPTGLVGDPKRARASAGRKRRKVTER